MPKTELAQGVYRFGRYTLDTERGELSDESGVIPLRPQSFEVLVLLVANRHRVVTKRELYEQVWGERAVTDDSLAQCVIDIRKALGDADRRIVRTAPRRGYRFTAKLAEQDEVVDRDAAAARSSGRRAGLLALAVVLAGPLFYWWLTNEGGREAELMENSIAVLPFVDRSAAGDQGYLGEGLSEDILNALARYPDIRVIARTSSFAMAERSADIRMVRDSLGVAYVLEGSVRRSSGRLRIAVQLVDTSDATQVWSERYDLDLQELAMAQQVISHAVAQVMVPDLQPASISPPERDVSVSELLLLARHYEREVRESPEVDRYRLQQAIELYRQAVEADPDSAIAHSRLARARLYGGDIDGAEPSVFRALALAPNRSEVQETLGRYYWARNMPGAGAAWKRAIELNPNNVDALSSYAYWHWIRIDSAEPLHFLRRALQLDPLNLSRYADLGFFLAVVSRTSETEDLIERIRELFDSAGSFRVIARLYDLLGQPEESVVWILRARDKEPDDGLHTAALAEVFVDIGDHETALRLEPEPSIGLLVKMRRYEEFIDEAEFLMIDEPDDVYLRYLLAFAYTATGRATDALRIFDSLGLESPISRPPRQFIDIEAWVTLAQALYETGRVNRAREIANWWLGEAHLDSDIWWGHLYQACMLTILDREAEALERLERVAGSTNLPWLYLLRDSPCFRRYRDEPRYQAVLGEVDARLAAARRRVNHALDELGVEL
ncbi:tetratricopeptide repeat protein [Lentisalinibacter sediminis]|uniref:tetratricopeptide repeat protein n=1 Tax=Lentisalinibacter sediminis TaxID=2992237 RepID=UPI00386EE18E